MKLDESTEVPVACDLSTFNSIQRKKHQALLVELLSSVKTSRELSNGYEFTLPGDNAWFVKLAEWVALEHLCCPFLSFEQGFRGNRVWLRLTGDENAKQFLRTMIEPIIRDGTPSHL